MSKEQWPFDGLTNLQAEALLYAYACHQSNLVKIAKPSDPKERKRLLSRIRALDKKGFASLHDETLTPKGVALAATLRQWQSAVYEEQLERLKEVRTEKLVGVLQQYFETYARLGELTLELSRRAVTAAQAFHILQSLGTDLTEAFQTSEWSIIKATLQAGIINDTPTEDWEP